MSRKASGPLDSHCMVNLMVGSTMLRWSKLTDLSFWKSCDSIINIRLPEGGQVCTGSEGPFLHILHTTIGHCDRHWRPHSCAKDLLKHFPSVSKVGGIQAEFEEVYSLIRRQASSLGQRSVLNSRSCAMQFGGHFYQLPLPFLLA